MAVDFARTVTWGRTCEEYERMFRLTPQDLAQGLLDCGGGPASFTAELSAAGYRAVAVDPTYTCSPAEIRSRFEAAVEPMLAQIRATPDDWVWTFHRDADDLLARRRAALETFMADYERGRRAGKYVVGTLPTLPFASGSFGLAVCSHLLFLYSNLFSAEFHIQSVRELCRLAREVRIFPLLTLQREPSPHLAAVRSALVADGWESEIVRVDFELQRGGNQMLRLFRA